MTFDDDYKLFRAGENKLRDKTLTFGDKVLIKAWLGCMQWGMKYLSMNAAEEKWVCAQKPEIDWEEVLSDTCMASKYGIRVLQSFL